MAASFGRIQALNLCHNFVRNVILRGKNDLDVYQASRTLASCCFTQEKSHKGQRVTHFIIPHRESSFFNTLTSDQIWAGVIASSGKQERKARGKRPAKRIRKDLNRGQYMGDGQYSMSWPGLNTNVIDDKQVRVIAKVPPQPEREERKQRIRDQWDRKKSRRVPIDERGWTSASFGGKKLGPPDPKPGETFEGFESCVISMRRVFNMIGTIGRKRSMSALVVVGNGNGVVGFAFGKAPFAGPALRKAKNKAANNLQYIERYEDHTVLHDFEGKFHKTRIRIKKQNKGYGIQGHRVVTEICKLAGVKDIKAKVMGAMNPIHITKALFAGFSEQESFQNIANRTGLNVVEFRKECGSLPIVKASPDETKKRKDVDVVAWDKTLPLEWMEEQPPSDRISKSSHFYRPGVVVL